MFIQAGFRSNCGIIGLAFSASLYGDLGLQIGGMLAGVSTILYNILSPIVFYACSDFYKPNLQKLVENIIFNPLNIGIFLGVFVSLLELEIPYVVLGAGENFASLSLPLALICIGASLSIDAFKTSRAVAFYAVLVKLILSPLIIISVLLYLGVRGQYLGVLFLFFASPTASASYIFAVMSGSDGKLAANIIVVSTIVSIPTTMIGLYVLYSNHLI
ncbi:MAG: AEC family transporter [Colwellia sp.]|nr:AEC family transporter [Colwellia sp.]